MGKTQSKSEERFEMDDTQDRTGNSSNGSGSRDEVFLMAASLRQANIETAGMTDDQVESAYREFAARRDREMVERRERLAKEDDELKRRQIERTEREEEGRRARMQSMRRELEAGGVDHSRLSDAQLLQEIIHLRRRQDPVWRRQRAEALFEEAKCPERHKLNLTGADRHPKWVETRDLLVDRLVNGNGYIVALLGKRGTGKTQLATSVIHRGCEALKSGRYIKTLDLFRAIRRTYTPAPRGADVDVENEADIIDDLAHVDLLVLDEAHQRGGTEFEQNLLVNLIDRRYDALRCTILAANQDKQAFAEAIGDSIVSRIHECGDALVCDWPSFRQPGSWLTAPPVRPAIVKTQAPQLEREITGRDDN